MCLLTLIIRQTTKLKIPGRVRKPDTKILPWLSIEKLVASNPNPPNTIVFLPKGAKLRSNVPLVFNCMTTNSSVSFPANTKIFPTASSITPKTIAISPVVPTTLPVPKPNEPSNSPVGSNRAIAKLLEKL